MLEIRLENAKKKYLDMSWQSYLLQKAIKRAMHTVETAGARKVTFINLQNADLLLHGNKSL